MITLVGACLVFGGIQQDPTAEELLDALRRKRPTNQVIPSATITDHDDSSRPLLYPEGYAIVEKTGWITRDGAWWTFVFDPTDDHPPVRILANANLEVMVMTVHATNEEVRFVTSGEMTVFRDQNYLLVHRAIRARRPRPPITESVKPKPASSDAPGVGTETTDPSVDRVIDSIRNLKPKKDAFGAYSDLTPTTSDGTATSPDVMPEGTVVVRRPGRLIRQQNTWTFAFESDHPDHPEPPIPLHPNKTVELMINTSKQDDSGLVFLVTGDLTLYRNHNFLLPRVAIRRIDSGNLTK